jgi:hypothetical protein
VAEEVSSPKKKVFGLRYNFENELHIMLNYFEDIFFGAVYFVQ